MPRPLIIVGCGYTGSILARQLCEEKHPPTVILRDPGRAALLGSLGARARRLDLDELEAGSFRDVDGAAVLYLAPPPGEGDDDPRIGRWLVAMGDGTPERLVYASTSGVYGDCRGAWIDEGAPVRAESARARRRVAAETRARRWCEARGTRLVVLRLAGIYGPGKLPLARLKAGEPMLRAEDCPWTNLVHAHDAVRAYRAALGGDPAYDLFNVASGEPVKMADYMDAVADAARLPRPRKLARAEAEERLRPSFLAFLRESRRLEVTRLREHLAAPRYARLVEGLEQAIGEGLDAAG